MSIKINQMNELDNSPANAPMYLNFGNYYLSVSSGELIFGGELLKLTDQERKMLKVFAANPGEAIGYSEFSDIKSVAEGHKIDIQINRLRRKIEKDITNPKFLETVRGAGYRLNLKH